MAEKIPQQPGYYWAKWLRAVPGTVEGDEMTPAVDFREELTRDFH